MNKLRRAIRRIILEGSHVDQCYAIGEMICSGDVETMYQGIELGISMGWISEDNMLELPAVKELNDGRGYMSQMIFDIQFPDGDAEAATYFEMDILEPMLIKACRFYQGGPDWATKHEWGFFDHGDYARVEIIGV